MVNKHKRQKSSILNIGYYIPENQEAEEVEPQEEYQNPRLTPPLLDYDNDPYLSYNFPNLAPMPPMNVRQNMAPPMVNDRFYYNQPMYLDQGFLYLPPPGGMPSGGMSSGGMPSGSVGLSGTVGLSNIELTHSLSLSHPSSHLPQSTVPNINLSPKPVSTANTPRRSPKRKYKHQKSSSMSSIPQFIPNPPMIPQAVDRSERSPERILPSIKHKQNLSISSHFNLFNLNEPEIKHEPLNPVVNDLLGEIPHIEPSTINNFLLRILSKANDIPLDDFYNLLYNDIIETSSNYGEKLDKSQILHHSNNNLTIINEILEIFKKPELVKNLNPPESTINENKLHNINYHELLRTFLAIKILQDMLIQLPRDEHKEITKYNIPRISLYKTYYIICQKLLLHYPSSFQSTNDHHKLILGQSKLGKLIKLVYPDLLIKRLGSRGESKYNYLGVIWNENIINGEIKNLCDDHELPQLNEIFNKQFKSKVSEKLPDLSLDHRSSNSSIEYDFVKSENSYINMTLKYPSNFQLLNWIGHQQTIFNDEQLLSSITSIFLNSERISIYQDLHNLMNSTNHNKLFMMILLQLTPIMLLIKPVNDLVIIKQNIIEFINEDNDDDLVKFKLILKNLINLNDCIISIMKVIFDDEMIINDFKNYFNSSNYLNNFLNSLISYNFELPVDLQFIDKDLSLVKKFFTDDLINWLNGNHFHDNKDELLNNEQFNSLLNFFSLLDNLILMFKSYSVNSSVYFIQLVSNDLLKLVYFRNERNFHHWWLVNNFIQDYMTLVGDLVGLNSIL